MGGNFPSDDLTMKDVPVLKFHDVPPPPVDIIEGKYSSYVSAGMGKAKVTVIVDALSKDRIARLMKSQRVQIEVVD